MPEVMGKLATVSGTSSLGRLVRRCALLVHVFCAVALAFSAFAHTPASFEGPRIAEASAFLLPDGTSPSICLGGTAGEGTSHPASHKYQPCEFCRIAGSAALPVQVGVANAILLAAESCTSAFPAGPMVATQAFQPGAPPQGPPFLMETT